MTLIDLSKLDSELCNTVYLGLCFAVLFSAEFAVVNIQRRISRFEGIVGHSFVYLMFMIGLWTAPPVIHTIGPCWALVISCFGFVYHLMTYSAENVWVIFVSTVIGGVSASILWSAHGNYLIVNSTRTTLLRNTGIFWSLFSFSEFFGNLVLYYRLEDKLSLETKERQILLYAMNGMAVYSIIMLVFLQNPEKQDDTEVESQQESRSTASHAVKVTWELMRSKNILILAVLFSYSGLQQSFAFGIFSSVVGFTQEFSVYSDSFLALSTIYISAGEVLGSAVQAMLHQVINRSRSNIMILTLLIQLLLYLVTFLTLPNNTEDHIVHLEGYLIANVYLAMLCSFLFGITDSIITIQIYNLLGIMYPDKSAQTCALYKFVKGVFTAFCFYIAAHWHLHTYITVLIPFAIASTTAYCYINKEFSDNESAESVTIIAEMSEIRNDNDDNSTDGSQRSLIVDL